MAPSPAYIEQLITAKMLKRPLYQEEEFFLKAYIKIMPPQREEPLFARIAFYFPDLWRQAFKELREKEPIPA